MATDKQPSTHDLVDALDELGGPSVAVMGDLILDHYVFGGVERISPEAPIPVLHVKDETDRLGGAANVAANVLSMGGKSSLIGVLGKDEGGQRFETLANATRGLTLMGTNTTARPTIIKTRMVSQNQQMLRVDREHNTALDASTAAGVRACAARAISDADALVLSDYNKGVLTHESCQEAIRLAQKRGIPVIVDPKGRDYSKYKGATAVTPNRAEAEAATGIDCRGMEGVENAGRLLCKQLGLKAAVITLSAQGVAIVPARGAMTHIPAQARSVYDVTGAGDTFIAAFAVLVAHGEDFVISARLANYAAGLKVARFGAVAITREELRRAVISAHEGFDHVGKVVTWDELEAALKSHRAKGERIVFTNGCFDILHSGHVTYLNFCRGHGDIVVVGLNSDASVRKLKGPQRPINDSHARARVLAALADVSYVTVFEDETPEELIRKVCPSVLVKGEDWAGKGVAGADFVEKNGGKVVFAPFVRGQSTSNTIAKIKHANAKAKT
ncbi:MAG: D-glycero-beta-D-manno-heptose-7-phosphate kinase [Planctomycetes bacterium]|nr:D-glycero-beta-D-manno-heptose-7-phosphate kinase [Planctomycetota bacterium]